jgi:hypothetical protein
MVVPLQTSLSGTCWEANVDVQLASGGWLVPSEAAAMLQNGSLREGVHLREVDAGHPAAKMGAAFAAAGGLGRAGGALRHAAFTSVASASWDRVHVRRVRHVRPSARQLGPHCCNRQVPRRQLRRRRRR